MSATSNRGLSPWLQDADVTLYHGDVLATLRELPAESVDCVVTSPPYWGLRDYGTGQWEGGDAGCDHVRDVRKYADGCVGCGAPMQEATAGCGHCADRHAKRRKHGTSPDRNYEKPSDAHWEKPRSRDQVTQAAQVFADICGKCGATRIDQQLGLEPTPEQYVERMVEVFREVRRVLAAHGTVWLNLGDSYAMGKPKGWADDKMNDLGWEPHSSKLRAPNLKPKDLVGIPWRVAFALQADGWYLRSDIIWAKPNPMPESVTDRPTKAHEYVFLLSKQAKYHFDQEAVREEVTSELSIARNRSTPRQIDRAAARQPDGDDRPRMRHYAPFSALPQSETLDGSAGEAPRGPDGRRKTTVQGADGSIQHRDGERWPNGGRNIRSVWEIATQPYPEAHFATFPEELARRCIAAGCPEQVCRVCGKARERIVRVTGPDGRSALTSGRHAYDEDGKPVMGDNMIDPGVRGSFNAKHVTLARETFGWTDCGCWKCPTTRGCSCVDECEEGGGDYRPGIVLDPFMGSGTVAHVARKLGRHAVGIDLNAEYLELAARRLQQQSLFAEPAA